MAVARSKPLLASEVAANYDSAAPAASGSGYELTGKEVKMAPTAAAAAAVALARRHTGKQPLRLVAN